jgi:hypothetical protein
MSNYESTEAIMESAMSRATDEYFDLRPRIHFIENRVVFKAGFTRAWNKRQEEIDRLKSEIETLRAKTLSVDPNP